MKIKTPILLIVFSFSLSIAFAQKKKIEKQFDGTAAISHFTYLASDELMGRDPIRPEISLAYNFIAKEFEAAGAKPLPNADGFFQNIPFRLSAPPSKGEIFLGKEAFIQGESLLVLDGPSISGKFPLIALGYGLEDDFEGKDVKGKVIICNLGAPNRMNPADLFAVGREKSAMAKKNGAIGLIEVYNVNTLPWNLAVNFLNRPQLTIDADSGEEGIPYLWMKDLKNETFNAVGSGEIPEVELKVEGKVNRQITGKNVIAYVEGKDKTMKNEYLMLSAHYDHIGVGRPDASGDSIYNGARDNAVGTVALIKAAKFFAKNPPKRSVLFCAWTAEEKGLLGSAYFADNPLVPLNQIIFNMNIDNGGYNDTSLITVIGLGRTSADFLIEEAVREFDLNPIPDPAPEQGLYDRSDNVNFARKGIPAPTFSLGFTAFDEEISKYYHQPGDHVDNFDLDYALLYWKSYILAAQKIANWEQRPKWNAGDKYEPAAKELYGD